MAHGVTGGITSVLQGGKFANGAITAAFAQAFNGEKAAEREELKLEVSAGFNKAIKRLQGLKLGQEIKADSEGGHGHEFNGGIGDIEVKVDSNGQLTLVKGKGMGLSVDMTKDVFREIIASYSPVNFSLSLDSNGIVSWSIGASVPYSPITSIGGKLSGNFHFRNSVLNSYDAGRALLKREEQICRILPTACD